MKKITFPLAVLLLLSLPFVALAAAGPTLIGRVAEKKLANGMTLLVLKRPGAPVVSLQMSFKVGGVDEASGRTGMAHLLEHMMFKGTKTLGTRDFAAEEPLLKEIEKVGGELDSLKRKGSGDRERLESLQKRLGELQKEEGGLVVKGEIDFLYARNGGVGLNATTSSDMTSYFVSLPSNRLELWAAIESDRMREPVLREYFTERAVVAEERRERNETQAGGMLYLALLNTAFGAHPYRNPVIGWPSDLDHLDLAATREFYNSHYGPDNAVVAAVGDVDPEGFFALVERYFGDIPARGRDFDPPTLEPAQTGPKKVVVHFASEPEAVLGYHKPTLPSRDDYIMDIVDGILSSGGAARLVNELVYKKKILASVSSNNGLPGARYDNLFAVFFSPAQGVTVDEAANAVRGELKRLTTDPPTREELDRVLAQLEAELVKGLVSDSAIARRLAFFQVVAGDWRYIEKLSEVLATVTPQEVAAAAARYFTDDNETFAAVVAGGAK